MKSFLEKENKHAMALRTRKVNIQDGRTWMKGSRTRGLVFAIPALLTLGFAVRPSRTESNYRFVSDPELDRRIEAYMPVVMATKPYLESNGKVKDSEASRLADLWIKQTEEGKLKALRPLMVGDAVMEGTTGQILKVQWGLVSTLMVRGEREAKRGDARRGAEDLILAARVLRPTQYSDPQVATLAGLQLRRALSALTKAAERMDSDDRTWLSQAVVPLKADNEQLTDMALTMRRLYDESVWRKTGASIPDTPGIAALSALRRPQPGAEEQTMQAVSEGLAASDTPDELRPLTDSLRRVLANEIHTSKRVDAIRSLD